MSNGISTLTAPGAKLPYGAPAAQGSRLNGQYSDSPNSASWGAVLPSVGAGSQEFGNTPQDMTMGERSHCAADEMELLFHELQENELEVTEVAARRADIEARLLTCEAWLDFEMIGHSSS